MMLNDNSSPFDEALLSKPFLTNAQPAKKRWSLFASSSSSSKKFALSERENGYCDSVTVTKYRAPVVVEEEEITFQAAGTQEHETDEEEGSFVLATTKTFEKVSALDTNLGVMRERHEGISEIHAEIQQINEIQKGL
jgi:hypothetical protein